MLKERRKIYRETLLQDATPSSGIGINIGLIITYEIMGLSFQPAVRLIVRRVNHLQTKTQQKTVKYRVRNISISSPLFTSNSKEMCKKNCPRLLHRYTSILNSPSHLA